MKQALLPGIILDREPPVPHPQAATLAPQAATGRLPENATMMDAEIDAFVDPNIEMTFDFSTDFSDDNPFVLAPSDRLASSPEPHEPKDELKDDQDAQREHLLPGFTLVGLLEMPPDTESVTEGRTHLYVSEAEADPEAARVCAPSPPFPVGDANGQPALAQAEQSGTAAHIDPPEHPETPNFADATPPLHIFTSDQPSLPPIIIIGLGLHKPGSSTLSVEASQALKQADVLGLPQKLLKQFARRKKLIIPLTAPLEPALQALEEHYRQGRNCVVLADGDPLLYGIGATLARRLPRHALRILPGISALQTACARIGLPWHDIQTASLHGRDNWLPLAHAALTGKPVCLYTDARHTPAHIARFLLERGVDWYRMAVASHLESPQESLAEFALHEAVNKDFPGGETVLLVPVAPIRGPHLGLDESTLVLDGGLYTKAPVRAAALSLMQLAPTDTVWDIGAGSGCLALEAAALVPRGRVIAVEQQPDRVLCIRENRRRLGVPQLDIITTYAPLGLDDLPDPHAIFLGGGLGGGLGDAADGLAQNSHAQATQSTLLLNTLFSRLGSGGLLVAACTLFSSLEFLTRYLQNHAIAHQVSLIQASVSAPLAGSQSLKAMNPIFLVQARKQDEQE